MCGLAWRCRASRSVKNACRVGARVLMILTGQVCFQPLSGQRHQLRRGGQVPECVLWIGVAQVSGQTRHQGGDVGAVAVPAQHGSYRKRMPDVMDPRPA